jgi:hypothetical protein
MLRDPYEVLTTVAHEVEHMYNWNASVKDVSKGGRHNEEFKDACESHGLVVEKHEKSSVGWTTVGFTDEMRHSVCSRKHCLHPSQYERVPWLSMSLIVRTYQLFDWLKGKLRTYKVT